jgi:DNA-directed RNA polymerase specialized sigma24 family protein
VVLHHYLDLPLDRVAEIVGAPIGTVGSRLHYATKHLRSALTVDVVSTTREVAR